MAKIIVVLSIFFLGASVGSFLSVVLYRIKNNKKGIIFGHSFCPSCTKKLTYADLIPIFSYMVLRGQCRHCKAKIPAQYLILELLSGLVFISMYFKFPFLYSLENGTLMPDLHLLWQFLFFCFYGSIFIAIFFYDLRTSKIPDLFLYPLIGAAILGGLVIGVPDIISMLIAVGIALVFFGGQILASKGKWLGDGDLFLAIGLAIIFGWKLFIVAVVTTYMLGAFISIILLLSKKAKVKSAVPFGPFLILGSFVTIFFGNEILNWYLTTIII